MATIGEQPRRGQYASRSNRFPRRAHVRRGQIFKGYSAAEGGFEEEEADGGEGDVVGEEDADPGAGVGLAGEDGGGGLHHAEQCGDGDGHQDEGEEELAVVGAQAHGGEEGSVADERPGAEGHDEEQQPGLAEGVEIVEEDEDGGEDELDGGDEDEVGEGFAEEEGGGRGGRHALGVEDAVALLAGPGLVERGEGGEEEGEPEDAAGDLAGDGGGGIEGEGEDDDDEQGEEEHADDGVAGAPLELEVFAEMGEDVAEVVHARLLGGEDGAGVHGEGGFG